MRDLIKSGMCEKIFLVGFFFTILTVTPYSVTDPINLPKMSVLGVLSFTLIGTCMNRRSLAQMKKQKLLIILTGLFVFQGLLILVLSGRSISQGLYGTSGRNTAFLTYLSLLLVLFTISQSSSALFIKNFLTVFFMIGVILLVYGLLQYFGLEPFPYVNTYESNVFGTFGNPNFQSAFMGIFGALLFALLFDQKNSLSRRLALILLLIGSVYGVYITNSWQGYFNLVAGIGIAVTLNLYRIDKTKLGNLFFVSGVVAGAAILLGLLNQGPLAAVLDKASLTARRLYWEAGVRMLVDHPLFGVGWDGFGDWYRRSRTKNANVFKSDLVSDSAHSVPLDVASGGGIPLLVLYLLLLALGVFSVIKVLKDKTHLSVNYIALVAVWVSYQAQSLISINQIALGIIGWSSLGLIIGYGTFTDNRSQTPIHQSSKMPKSAPIKNLSFLTLFTPLIGFIVGCLVSLPPYIAASKFYEGLKTSDARVINSNGYLKPLDLRRMIYTASILEKNGYHKESFDIMKSATENFPDSYEAWSFLSTLTNSTESDKTFAKSELVRLDPSQKP